MLAPLSQAFNPTHLVPSVPLRKVHSVVVVGLDVAGFDVLGLDVVGVNVVGVEVVGVKVVGLDVVGLDVVGFNVAGLNVAGLNVVGFNVVVLVRQASPLTSVLANNGKQTTLCYDYGKWNK